MGIVVIIDGREAIPVRAIPFVAGWMISPDGVAKSFAKTDHWITRLDGVAAYYLSAEGEYSPMLAKEWDVIEADLEILSDKLKATEEVEQENYSVWRQQSILRLPASCFVWCDEFEEAFRHSYSPERLILLNERPGDRELNFSPRIPEELTLAVMQGFSVIQPNNNSSSSVEKPLYPKEGEAHRKTETPEQRRERLRARVREVKAKGIKPFLRLVAKEEGFSVARLKQLTSADRSSLSKWSGLNTAPKLGASSNKLAPSSKRIKPKH